MRSPIDLEPVQNAINHWAVEIRRTRIEAMEVTVQPNPQTEVALRLRLDSGAVAVAAEFKRGDLAGLAAHWPELQASLSTQGIRLGPLQPAPADSLNFSTSGDSRHSSGPLLHEPERNDALFAKRAAPSPVQNQPSSPNKSPSRSTSGRRWETWA
jgi:hypothetical protein